MQKRVLGKTGLEVSAIGFGGDPIRRVPMKEARRLVKEALYEGINFFDTAQAYEDSEIKIGEGVREKRDNCFLATKSTCLTAQEALSDVEKALKRLRTNYIDLYQIHNVRKPFELEKVLSPGGALEGLVQLKEIGKIKHIGITGHDPKLLQTAIQTREEFETVQFAFNIVESEEVKFSLLNTAKDLHVGTIIMKPLAGGVISEPELSLRWLLQQGVDIVIPGMILSSQIKENAMVGKNPEPLSSEGLSRLKDAVKDLAKEFCRRCMYCEPCPQGVLICMIQELGDKVTVNVDEVREMSKDTYASLEKHVTDCAECGECEEKCPYELPVRRMIQEKHILLTS